MNAQELLHAGKLQEAIQAVSNELRDHPGDTRRRTFLFEMLCFTGDFSRAEKHLTLLSDSSPDAAVGALLYRSALSGERKRHAFFEAKQYDDPMAFPPPKKRAGKLNGEPFWSLEDIDPRIGARLEVFIAGEYVWLPLAHIGTLTMGPPRYLRDLLWASATITAGPALEGKEFGEVLLPVLYPFSSGHTRDTVKLGRETDWILAEVDPIEIPYGQKLFVVDEDKCVPILEIRELQFNDSVPPPPA
jgi:type VI secretion system protein ImpE